jgi:hypothetical protein
MTPLRSRTLEELQLRNLSEITAQDDAVGPGKRNASCDSQHATTTRTSSMKLGGSMDLTEFNKREGLPPSLPPPLMAPGR